MAEVKVEITDESLVPDNLCVWQGEIDGATWAYIVKAVENFVSVSHLGGIRMVRTPNKAAIRAVLESRCNLCYGRGKVDTEAEDGGIACGSCGGTGKGSVAGAKFVNG